MTSYQCGFDDGDCANFREAYPTYSTLTPNLVGNGECQIDLNSQACGFDGGDCCPVRESPYWGDEICHAGLFDSIECMYDQGDCDDDLRKKYPSCPAYFGTNITGNDGFSPVELGNGICDEEKQYMIEYMTVECGWVFGDCSGKGDINFAK